MPLQGEYEPQTSNWAREQAEAIMERGDTEGTTIRGRPVILLTTVGAKSGKLRKIPLMRVEHEGEYAIVASLGGAPKHPVWYYNVVNHPHVELQDGTVTKDYLAREVHGEEKAIWWERAVAAYPDYADYQKKTSREIPVFVLTEMTEEQLAAASTPDQARELSRRLYPSGSMIRKSVRPHGRSCSGSNTGYPIA
jgi:deazaflavin-dependent oxidoreductase (nitroreductase family)